MYRVLIVDDEAIIRKGLRSTIEWDGLGLELCGEAHNGQEALAVIQATRPNILITDIRMPGMDGITLIQTIRERGIPIKIIILSGYSDYAFLKDAIRLGVDGYLLKPIDIDELISNIKDLVNTIENEMLRSSQLKQGIELLRSNTLNRLVANAIGLREFEEKASFLEIALEGKYHLCVVCASESEEETPAGYSEQTVQSVLQIAIQTVAGLTGIVFLDLYGRVVLLLDHDNKDDLLTAAAQALSAIIREAREQCGIYLACGSGLPVASIEEIWKSYVHATAQFSRRIEAQEAAALEGRNNTVVDRALAYVAENYRDALSLKQLAGILDINTSYLGQIFKKTTGESFTGYVNRYRVHQAKELLSHTALKVYEVAQEVGFTDYHYFLIIFKKITGINPTDIRSQGNAE